jgi:hypothetical protein
MKSRTELILWDVALVAGVLLFFFWNISEHYNLIVGIITVMILSFTIQKHIAAYKLNGRIY